MTGSPHLRHPRAGTGSGGTGASGWRGGGLPRRRYFLLTEPRAAGGSMPLADITSGCRGFDFRPSTPPATSSFGFQSIPHPSLQVSEGLRGVAAAIWRGAQPFPARVPGVSTRTSTPCRKPICSTYKTPGRVPGAIWRRPNLALFPAELPGVGTRTWDPC